MKEEITERILEAVEYMVLEAVKKLRLDRHIFGVASLQGNGLYTVVVGGGLDVFTDVRKRPYIDPIDGDFVSVLIPNSDFTRAVIDDVLHRKAVSE